MLPLRSFALFFVLSLHISSVLVVALKRPGAAASHRSFTFVLDSRNDGKFLLQQPRRQQPLELNLDLALSLRAGAQEEEGLVASVRGLFDKFVSFLEKQSPGAAQLFRSVLTSLESITGMELVSKPEKKKSVKKKKKKKKSSSDGSSGKTKKATDGDGDSKNDEAETTTTTTTISSKATSSKKKSSLQKSVSKSKSLASAHVQKEIKATSPNYRIQRELKAFLSDPPPNLKVKVGKNLRVWIVTMKGVGIYEGETFQLRISFPAQYPTVPPSVYFLPPNIPVHEHVYTNGDICLSLLGKDWRPTMTAQSIAVSILSILSSAQSKSLPMDNARHAQNKPGEYQKDWVYHDDNC